MAIRTAPGPLSIGLYIFLWILTIVTSTLFAAREWKLVSAWREVAFIASQVIPVSCQSNPINNGKVIHIDCPLKSLSRFHPPSEFAWNVPSFDGVFFDTRVEMYQWISPHHFFSFKGVWSEQVVGRGSTFGLYDLNPDFIPRVPGAGRQFASKLTAGDYILSKSHLAAFRDAKQLPLSDDPYYSPSLERPPTSVSYINTQVYQNYLYTGDPLNPKVGDIRISFWGSAATHVSAIGVQTTDVWGNTNIGDSTNNKIIATNITDLVGEGDYTPTELIKFYRKKKGGGFKSLWLLRGIELVILSALVGFTYRLIDRHGHTTLAPFILGSICMSAGLMISVCLAPLWLATDTIYGIALIVSGPLLILSGLVVWRLGKTLVPPYQQLIEHENPSGSVEFKQINRPEHFYQAI